MSRSAIRPTSIRRAVLFATLATGTVNLSACDRRSNAPDAALATDLASAARQPLDASSLDARRDNAAGQAEQVLMQLPDGSWQTVYVLRQAPATPQTGAPTFVAPVAQSALSYAPRRQATRAVHTAPAAPASRRIVQRHTKRDMLMGALIGAGAGNAIGHGSGKDALIGAAAGALLGGIVGHKFDVQHR